MSVSQQTSVLIVPPFYENENQTFNLSFQEHDAKIKFFLTYFQRINVLTFNIPIFTGQLLCSTELEQELAQQGIVRPLFPADFEIGGVANSQFFSHYARYFYDMLATVENVPTALAPFPEMLPHMRSDELNCLVLSMRSCLPCPDINTNIVDIIDFRNRNHKQLTKFYSTLNSVGLMFSSIESVQDKFEAISDNLNSSIDEIIESYSDFGLKWFPVSLNVSFSLPKSIVVSLAEAIAQYTGLPAGFGALVASNFELTIEPNNLSKLDNQYPRDFQYIVNGIRDRIFQLNEDPDFIPDLNNILIENNKVPALYPKDLTPPIRINGLSFKNNVIL